MEYKAWYKSQKSWLSKHTPYISDLLLELDAKGLVNVTKKAEIEGKIGPVLQCEALYDHLVGLGLGRLGDIIHCLHASENTRVEEVFKECAAKVATGAITEQGPSGSAFSPAAGQSAAPGAPKKRNVAKEYKDWVIAQKADLADDTTEIPSLLNRLESSGVIKESAKDAILANHGAVLQANALYTLLSKYGLEQVDKVISCLEASGNSHIAKRFQQWSGCQ